MNSPPRHFPRAPLPHSSGDMTAYGARGLIGFDTRHRVPYGPDQPFANGGPTLKGGPYCQPPYGVDNHAARLPGFMDSAVGMLSRAPGYFNTPPAGQSYGLHFNSSMQASEKGQKKTEKQEIEPLQEAAVGLPAGWNPSGGRPQMNGAVPSSYSVDHTASFDQVMPQQGQMRQRSQVNQISSSSSSQYSQRAQHQSDESFWGGKEYPFHSALGQRDFPLQSQPVPQPFLANADRRTSGESSAEQLVVQNRNGPVGSTGVSSVNSLSNNGGSDISPIHPDSSSGQLQLPDSTTGLDLCVGEDKKMDRSATESPPTPRLIIATSPQLSLHGCSSEPKIKKLNAQQLTPKQGDVSYLYQLSTEPGRKLFVDKLIHFYNSSVNSAVHLPEFCSKPLDLYTLYQMVDEQGGLQRVITDRLWGNVAAALKADASQDHSSTLYKHYWTYLLPFVCQEQGLDMSIETLRLQQIEIEHGDDRTQEDGAQPSRGESSADVQPSLDDFNLGDQVLSGSTSNLADADLPLPFDLTAEDLKEVESLFESSQLDFDKPPEPMPLPQLEQQASQLIQQQQLAPIRSHGQMSGPSWSQQYSQPSMSIASQQPPTSMHRPVSYPTGPTRQSYSVKQPRFPYLRDRLAMSQQQQSPSAELFSALQRRYLANQQHHQAVQRAASLSSPTHQILQPPFGNNAVVRQADVWHPPTPPSYRSLSNHSVIPPSQLGPRFPSVPRPDLRSVMERHRQQSTALPHPPTDTWESASLVAAPGQLPSVASSPTGKEVSEEMKMEVLSDDKLEFPSDCIESTEPLFTTRYKVTAQNLGQLNPRQLILSLKSGLLAECTWVLDALNILLYDDRTMPLFHLSRHPRLLDLLLDHFYRCLESIFGKCLSPGEGDGLDWGSMEEGDWDGWSDDLEDNVAHDTRYVHTHFDGDGEAIAKGLSKSWPLVDIQETSSPLEPSLSSCVSKKKAESCSGVVCREDGPFTIETDSQTNLKRRCCCISNILRSLSYIPGNDVELCLHARFLHLIAQVLSLHFEPWLPLPHLTDSADNVTGGDGPGTEWWWLCLESLREDALVTLSNIAGQLNLSLLPQAVGHPLVEALVNWLVCESPSSVDPFKGKLLLSPRSLALEALSKVALLEVNLDLVLSTPSSAVLTGLIDYLTSLLIDQRWRVQREFALVLLSCLLQGNIEEYALEHLKQSPRIVSHFVGFLETAEAGAAAAVLQARSFSFPLEAYGTSVYMLYRAALGVLALAKLHPPLFACYQRRLLSLSTSRLLDSYVSGVLADALMELSSP